MQEKCHVAMNITRQALSQQLCVIVRNVRSRRHKPHTNREGKQNGMAQRLGSASNLPTGSSGSGLQPAPPQILPGPRPSRRKHQPAVTPSRRKSEGVGRDSLGVCNSAHRAVRKFDSVSKQFGLFAERLTRPVDPTKAYREAWADPSTQEPRRTRQGGVD